MVSGAIARRFRGVAEAVEPVFGIIKEAMGFRRFTLRGHANVSLEWTVVCLRHNLKRPFSLKNLAAAV